MIPSEVFSATVSTAALITPVSSSESVSLPTISDTARLAFSSFCFFNRFCASSPSKALLFTASKTILPPFSKSGIVIFSPFRALYTRILSYARSLAATACQHRKLSITKYTAGCILNEITRTIPASIMTVTGTIKAITEPLNSIVLSSSVSLYNFFSKKDIYLPITITI